MLHGECLCSGASSTCPDCKTLVTLDVHRSAAGWYIGTYCGCGPYTRESGYYRTEDEARAALSTTGWKDRAGNFNPGDNQ